MKGAIRQPGGIRDIVVTSNLDLIEGSLCRCFHPNPIGDPYVYVYGHTDKNERICLSINTITQLIHNLSYAVMMSTGPEPTTRRTCSFKSRLVLSKVQTSLDLGTFMIQGARSLYRYSRLVSLHSTRPKASRTSGSLQMILVVTENIMVGVFRAEPTRHRHSTSVLEIQL